MDLLKYYYNLHYENGNLFPSCRTKIIPITNEIIPVILSAEYLSQQIDKENAIKFGKYYQCNGNHTKNNTSMNVLENKVYYPERFLFVLPKDMKLFFYIKDTFIPEELFGNHNQYTIEDEVSELTCTAIAITVYYTHPNSFWSKADDKDFVLKLRDLVFYLGTKQILHINDSLEKGFFLEDNKVNLLSKIEKWKEIVVNNFIARCKNSVSHLNLREYPHPSDTPVIKDWE